VKSLSIESAVRLGGIAIALSRTWRYRDARRPDGPPRPPERPVIFAAWHEHVLSLALYIGRWGAVGLASRGRDGEIISRLAARTGALAARGSTSRGGEIGARELVRAARAGRSIFVTPDGPRGPRRVCHPGVLRLAEITGLPIVPLGIAATSGLRLDTWDRFLLPAPFARLFLARGPSIEPDERDGAPGDLARSLGEEITRAARVAEAVAAEARGGRPYAVRSASSAPVPEGRGPARLSGRSERRARRAWTGTPPLDLRIAGGAFALGRVAREGLYRGGIARAAAAPLPVISIGGVTVGGSGKTPLVAEVAGWLEDAGHRVAILTRGYPDELLLHRRARPRARVLGHPDRTALTRRADAAGSTVAVLDDGLQHRRLGRDVDVLALDRDALRRTNRRPLPAGPFREPPAAAARRADVVIMTGRELWSPELDALDDEWLDRLGGGRIAASLVIEAGPPTRVRGPDAPAPTVALTGIMKPNLFFELARRACPTIEREHAVPDHGRPGREWGELVARARPGGFLMTEKDRMRLESLVPPDVAIWILPETIRWLRGVDAVRERILTAAGTP